MNFRSQTSQWKNRFVSWFFLTCLIKLAFLMKTLSHMMQMYDRFDFIVEFLDSSRFNWSIKFFVFSKSKFFSSLFFKKIIMSRTWFEIRNFWMFLMQTRCREIQVSSLSHKNQLLFYNRYVINVFLKNVNITQHHEIYRLKCDDVFVWNLTLIQYRRTSSNCDATCLIRTMHRFEV